jgi:hypothetical protein
MARFNADNPCPIVHVLKYRFFFIETAKIFSSVNTGGVPPDRGHFLLSSLKFNGFAPTKKNNKNQRIFKRQFLKLKNIPHIRKYFT